MSNGNERAVLAGGCFWGMQDLIRRMPGVISTRVGYSGGDVPNATYRNHGTHAEAIEIIFDPRHDQLPRSARILLPDPRPDHAQPAGQRCRRQLSLGDLLYQRRAEAQVAEDTIADVDASGLWPGKVVTEVSPAGDSGRPSRNIRTIWSNTPTATPAISRGRTGSCRAASPPAARPDGAAPNRGLDRNEPGPGWLPQASV